MWQQTECSHLSLTRALILGADELSSAGGYAEGDLNTLQIPAEDLNQETRLLWKDYSSGQF